jgi:hypothetical protein
MCCNNRPHKLATFLATNSLSPRPTRPGARPCRPSCRRTATCHDFDAVDTTARTRHYAALPAPFGVQTAWTQRRARLHGKADENERVPSTAALQHNQHTQHTTRRKPFITINKSPETTTLNVIELHPKSLPLLINLERESPRRCSCCASSRGRELELTRWRCRQM